MLKHVTLLLFLSLLCFTGLKADHDDALRFHIPAADYPPYVITENEQAHGWMIDPLRQAAEELGLELILIPLPTKRADLMLEEGEIDARFKSRDWVPDPDSFLWSDEVRLVQDVLIYRHGLNFEQLDDLQGVELLVGLGYHYPSLQPLFDQGLATRTDFAFTRDILPALLREDAQKRAAVMNIEVARWLMAETPELREQLEISDWVIHSTSMRYQFARSSRMEALLPRLNEAIRRALAAQE